MYAYEYGLEKFSIKDQHDSIAVFNDRLLVVKMRKPDEPEPKKEFFVQVVFYESDPTIARPIENGIKFDADFANDYLLGQNLIELTNTSKLINTEEIQRVYGIEVLEATPQFYDIYKFDGNYFIYLTDTRALNPVFLFGKAKKRRLAPIDRVDNIIENSGLSVLLFISDDGVKLERAYQSITKILPNEIVLFIEINDSYNIFGSVIRVRSGDSITPNSNIPYGKIAKLASIYKTDVGRGAVKEVLIDHVKDKEGVFYFIRKALLFGSRILKMPQNFALKVLSEGLDYVSEGIENNIKISSKYWKLYNDDGSENEEYDPILPGYGLIESLDEFNKNADYGKMFAPYLKKLDLLEQKVEEGIETMRADSLKKFLRRKLSVFFDLIKLARKFIKEIISGILEFAKQLFIFLNAFLIGVINSLIDLVKSIFDIVSLICKAVLAKNKFEDKVIESPGSYLSLFMEFLENTIEATVDLLQFRNIKIFFNFLGETFYAFKEKITNFDVDSVSITADSFGYGLGYVIGFVIEEIIFTILTGGAKTVASALQVAAKSYSQLLKGVYKAGARGVQFSFDSFISLFAYIRKRLKNFQGLLDDLLEWIKKILKAGKNALDNIYKTFFNKGEKKFLEKYGFTPSKFDDGILTLCPIKKV